MHSGNEQRIIVTKLNNNNDNNKKHCVYGQIKSKTGGTK